MNPSAAELVAAIAAGAASEVGRAARTTRTSLLAAHQAAELAAKPAEVVRVALDPGRARRARRLRPGAHARPRTRDAHERAPSRRSPPAPSTTASRAVDARRRARSRRAATSGCVEGEPVAGGADFDARRAPRSSSALLAEPRELLTLITGERRAAARAAARAAHGDRHPDARARRPGRRPAALPAAARRRIGESAGRWPRRSGSYVVEDNDVYRDALELLLGLRGDLEVVGSVADGADAAVNVNVLRPDVVPDGLPAPRARRRRGDVSWPGSLPPETAVICLTAAADVLASATPSLAAGAVACLSKDEGFESVVAAILHRGWGQENGAVNLTAANTAIVLDSTSDFPDCGGAAPHWRVVPLYVRFGDESFRDYVELSPEVLLSSDCAQRPSCRPCRSRPLRTLHAAYDELDGYARILSIHISGRLSGTIESARTAAALKSREPVRAIDSGTASAAIAMLALGIQRRLEAGTTDEDVDAFVERFRREAGLLFTVETLEFLARGGRIGRARAAAGQLLQVKPILTIEDGEVIPVGRAHGSRKALAELASEFERRTGRRQRADGRPRPLRRACTARSAARACHQRSPGTP